MNYEIIYDFLTQPKIAIAKIKAERPWLLPFLVVTFAFFTQSLSVLQFYIKGERNILFFLGTFLLLRIFLIVIILFLLSAFFHSFAQLLGGQGRTEELFLSLGFSFSPLFFLLPAGIFLHFLEVTQLISKIWLIFFLYNFLNFLLFFWILYLQILSIKEIYSLSVGQAIWVYFLPFFIFLAIGLILVTILIFSIVFLFR